MLRAYIAYQGIKNRAIRFVTEDRGATAIEYGLIAAGIAVAIAAIVYTVGDDLVAMFEEVSTGIQGRG